MIHAALRHRAWAETLRALPDLASGVGAALVILAGHANGLGSGTIAAALAVLGLTLSPLRDLGTVWNHHAAFRAAVIKADAALSRQTRDRPSGGAGFPKAPVDLILHNVKLPATGALDIATTGQGLVTLPITDADTHSLFNMLMGLDRVDSGQIRISGVDLTQLSNGSLRRNVHRIGGNPEILQGSLRRALSMGCSEKPTDQTLQDLAHKEGLGPALQRLGGLGGRIVEGGRNLTHGERLGLACVRMRLLRPKLILLDTDCSAAILDRVAVFAKEHSATVLVSACSGGAAPG